MIIIANSAAEESSAWRALEVINSLRSREHNTVRPDVADAANVRTAWAHPRYL